MTDFGARPAEITAELVATWEAKRKADPECGFMGTSALQEIYYAGEYIDVLLGRIGAPQQDMERLSFEMGQRAWPRAKNVWGIVASLVEGYKAGRAPKPGLETAEEVLQERIKQGGEEAPMKLKVTPGHYFGQEISIVCDARCDKAWGTVDRPQVQLDDKNEDDFAWLADRELGTAPDTSSTSEGSDVKPVTIGELRHNKWCARSCERSSIVYPGSIIEPKTFEERFYNIPSSDPENKT